MTLWQAYLNFASIRLMSSLLGSFILTMGRPIVLKVALFRVDSGTCRSGDYHGK